MCHVPVVKNGFISWQQVKLLCLETAKQTHGVRLVVLHKATCETDTQDACLNFVNTGKMNFKVKVGGQADLGCITNDHYHKNCGNSEN